LTSRSDLFSALVSELGAENVVTDRLGRLVYGSDASQQTGEPSAVILAAAALDVEKALRVLARLRVPVVCRGRGTGYTGGAVPYDSAAVLSLERWRGPVEVDEFTRSAVVPPGLTLAEVNEAARAHALYFPVDPISANHCSIGGVLSENSSGPRCLMYGPTHQYVLGYEAFSVDGVRRWVDRRDPDFYAFLSAEGTLGVIGRVRIRLVPAPVRIELVRITFDAGEVVPELQRRIYDLPYDLSALEMITPSYSPRVGRLGPFVLWAERIHDGAATFEGDIREALTPLPVEVSAEHGDLYALRGSGYRRSREYIADEIAEQPVTQLIDGVVPRAALPAVVDAMFELAGSLRLPLTHTFHFGDGNIHPTFFHRPGEVGQRMKEETLSAVTARCLALGGSLGGEHGIGLEKQAMLGDRHSVEEITVFRALKETYDPGNRCNPGKIFPAAGKDLGPVRLVRSTDGQPGAVDVMQMTLTADATSTVARLAEIARKAGLWLAYEAFGVDDVTTVGAAAEQPTRNLFGLTHGELSDHVLGASFPYCGGPSVRFGSPLVKDISGYMIHRLRARPAQVAAPATELVLRLWKRSPGRGYRVVLGRCATMTGNALEEAVGRLTALTRTSGYALWLARSGADVIAVLRSTLDPITIERALRVEEVPCSAPLDVLGQHTIERWVSVPSFADGAAALADGRLDAWVPQLEEGYRIAWTSSSC
jgi:glycolate oxidase